MTTPTFYVLHGEDEFSLKAQITAMQAAMNDPSQLNTSVLDGTQVSAQQVLNTASSFPFLSDKRLVIVEGMLSHLGGRSSKELDVLVEGLPNLPDFARLVFHEDKTLPEKNLVLQLARSHPRGFEKTFAAPKNATQWIIQHAKQQHHLEIENRAAAALASVIGQNLRAADSELAKLAAYVDYARPIREADVATLTPYVAEANIFDMVDAIGQQDGKTAMTLLQKLLAEGAEPLSILGMINRQFHLLILAREHTDNGGGSSDMASVLGVHSFVAQKVGQQARRFSLETLESIYRKLVDLDFRIKTGQVEADMALQLFIAGVTN
jgi:DNA polymerase-3 subunit delta